MRATPSLKGLPRFLPSSPLFIKFSLQLCIRRMSLTPRWFESDIWWGRLPWKDVPESSFYQSHCCHHQLDERCWTDDVRVFACNRFLTLWSWLTYPSLFNVKVGWSNGEYSRSIWVGKFYQRGLIDWISYGEAIFLCSAVSVFWWRSNIAITDSLFFPFAKTGYCRWCWDVWWILGNYLCNLCTEGFESYWETPEANQTSGGTILMVLSHRIMICLLLQ